MNAIPPTDDRHQTPRVEVVTELGTPTQDLAEAAGAVPAAALSAVESRVLTVLSEERHLSFAILRTRVGAPTDELRSALDGLRARGLVSRLNTLGESYASRFPGLSVDD